MLGGQGYFRGSTVLVSGKAGTGKSTLSAAFVEAACRRNESVLYLALEESASQLCRNMRSVGIDLAPWMEKGLLSIKAFRPTAAGLEEHLVEILDWVDRLGPRCVVMDPITNFVTQGALEEVKSMLMRVFDHLKTQGVTLFLTALTPGSGRPDETETDVSSLIDTWIALDLAPVGPSRRRELRIVKSRGMPHQHEAMEMIMSAEGLSLRDIPSPSSPHTALGLETKREAP
jgi:circadian clock protein KaiC